MYSYSELSNTVLRSIKEVLGLSIDPLLTDNIMSKLDADELDLIEIVMSVEEYLDIDWGISWERISELDLTVKELIDDLAGELKVPVDQEVKSETYTPEQLSYISELEDRVEYLEQLCSDYAAEIEQLRGVTIKSEDALKTEFKPISDMTMEDWQQSLDEEWEFETVGRGMVKVIMLDDFNDTLPIYVSNGSSTQWLNADGSSTSSHPEWTVIKRIK